MDEVMASDSYDPMDDLFMTDKSPITKIRSMDSSQWSIFVAGILLFVVSKPVAHHAFTFYASSALLSIPCSIAFLALFIRRFLPSRIFMVPVDWLGAPALSYIYYYGYTHIQEILRQNWKWLTLYITVTVAIALIICYVSNIASNDRVQDVLQWTLQSVSVMLMFYSSQNVPLTATAIILIFAINQGAHRYIWQFIKKPETRPLLTKEEYEKEKEEFTRNELEKLRLSLLEDCRYNSPERSFTKRCQNKEQLANFLVSGQDVSINAQMEYQKELSQTDEDDDESSMDIDSGADENVFLSDDD